MMYSPQNWRTQKSNFSLDLFYRMAKSRFTASQNMVAIKHVREVRLVVLDLPRNCDSATRRYINGARYSATLMCRKSRRRRTWRPKMPSGARSTCRRKSMLRALPRHSEEANYGPLGGEMARQCAAPPYRRPACDAFGISQMCN